MHFIKILLTTLTLISMANAKNYFKTNDANVIMPFVITKDLPLTAGTHLFEIRFRNSGGVANLRYGSMRARLVN